MTWKYIHLTHIALCVIWCVVLILLAHNLVMAEDIRPDQELVKVVTFTEDGTKITYEVRPEHKLHVLDFTGSRFTMPPDTVADACDAGCKAVKRQQRIEQAAAYIHKHERHADATAVATAMVDGSADHPELLWLAVAVARYESSFRPQLRGKYSGLFQCDAARCRQMPDPHNAEDQVRYFVNYVGDHLAAGDSLRKSLQPWSVKDRAIAEYKRLK